MKYSTQVLVSLLYSFSLSYASFSSEDHQRTLLVSTDTVHCRETGTTILRERCYKPPKFDLAGNMLEHPAIIFHHKKKDGEKIGQNIKILFPSSAEEEEFLGQHSTLGRFPKEFHTTAEAVKHSVWAMLAYRDSLKPDSKIHKETTVFTVALLQAAHPKAVAIIIPLLQQQEALQHSSEKPTKESEETQRRIARQLKFAWSGIEYPEPLSSKQSNELAQVGRRTVIKMKRITKLE